MERGLERQAYGIHSTSSKMSHVALWLWSSGLAPRDNSISKWTRLYRENAQSGKKKQRKMTDNPNNPDNPNSSGSHILTQIEKFFFLSYFSFFLIQKGTD